MKLDPKFIFATDSAHPIAPEPVLAFVAANHAGLWQAARLLGGGESSRLVDRCAELLEQDRRVTPRTRIMLGQILAVLSLEHVDDPDLPYMAHFAAIDPADPVVEEICLLTDELREALEMADRDHPPASRNLAAA